MLLPAAHAQPLGTLLAACNDTEDMSSGAFSESATDPSHESALGMPATRSLGDAFERLKRIAPSRRRQLRSRLLGALVLASKSGVPVLEHTAECR